MLEYEVCSNIQYIAQLGQFYTGGYRGQCP